MSVPDYAGCAVLALLGELDFGDAAELSSRLSVVMSRESWVIVNLADLTFMDCSSLGLLVGARERARLAGGDVLLAGPRPAVARLLALTGQDHIFPVFPGVALAAFSAGLAASGAGGPVAVAVAVAVAVEGMVAAAGLPAAVTMGID